VYIQFIVLKKTLKSISYDYRRSSDEVVLGEPERASKEQERKREYVSLRWRNLVKRMETM